MKQDRAPHVQFHHHELAGRPLTTLRTTIELILATSTTAGLTIQAAYDPNPYPRGIKITDAQLAAVPLRRHEWHGKWKYTMWLTLIRTGVSPKQGIQPSAITSQHCYGLNGRPRYRIWSPPCRGPRRPPGS